jgi:hypothetical protein
MEVKEFTNWVKFFLEEGTIENTDGSEIQCTVSQIGSSILSVKLGDDDFIIRVVRC